MNDKDYGTAIICDPLNNVYVSGATFNGNSNNYDYVVIKYDPNGNLLWQKFYNGPGNSYDIPVAVTLDNSLNIYVTGTSVGLGTLTDYATIKYNNSGQQKWVKRYNYTNMPDIPSGILVDNSGNIIVTGSSGSSLTNWDYATIKYSPAGQVLASHRHPSQGNGFDRPEGIGKDINGNIYISGIAYINSNYCNIKTLKYNSGLSLIWQKIFDGDGFDEKVNSISVNNSGNVLIAGSIKKANSNKDLVSIKYDQAGNLLWSRRQQAFSSYQDAEARKARLDNSGNVFLTGYINDSIGSNFLTLKYDSLGNLKWLETYRKTQSSSNTPDDIRMDTSGVYVIGKISDSSLTKYNTIKYSDYSRIITPVFDSLGNPSYVDNEIIVRFDTSDVIRTNVNNRDKQYGMVTDFIKPSVFSLMSSKAGVSFGKLTMFKVFREMTTDDTISISRLGEEIRIPPFWATFVIVLPSSVSEETVCDSLNKLFPIIRNASLNLLGQLQDIPWDTYIDNQLSLVPQSGYTGPVNHINMARWGSTAEYAWDIETGREEIRVGIFDTGIYFGHWDFSIPGQTSTFDESKIKDGWDYVADCAIEFSPNPDDDGHGTKCAGIVGALRNNAYGIAGIAGGDMQNNNSGVSLYALRVGSQYTLDVANFISALYKGAIDEAGGGYQLNAANISALWYPVFPEDYVSLYELKDAVKFAFRNKVSVSTARGNYQGQYSSINFSMYPACFNDEMVINVGASDSQGNYNNGEDNYASMYGGEGTIDVIAPGVSALVYTIKNTTSGYTSFAGTSASTPHVTGVASLLLSYFNEGKQPEECLAPEDVEYILKNTAVDKDITGPDIKTGYGLIDATAALKAIKFPYYTILHPQVQYYPLISVNINTDITLDFNYENYYQNAISAGNYKADIYRLTADGLNTNLGFAGNNYEVIDAWKLFGSSAGMKYMQLFDDISDYDEYLDIDNTDIQNKSVLTTYYYHLTYDYSTGSNIDIWMPCNPLSFTGTKLAYSVYLRNKAAGIEEFTENNINFDIYPNPCSSDHFTLSVETPNIQQVDFNLFNYLGQNINNIFNGQVIGERNIDVDVSTLSNGVYFIVMKSNDRYYYKKLIIQN